MVIIEQALDDLAHAVPFLAVQAGELCVRRREGKRRPCRAPGRIVSGQRIREGQKSSSGTNITTPATSGPGVNGGTPSRRMRKTNESSSSKPPSARYVALAEDLPPGATSDSFRVQSRPPRVPRAARRSAAFRRGPCGRSRSGRRSRDRAAGRSAAFAARCRARRRARPRPTDGRHGGADPARGRCARGRAPQGGRPRRRRSSISPPVWLSSSACFCGRVSFLISASRCMAPLCVSNISLYASSTGPRPRVYFAPLPLLCASRRAAGRSSSRSTASRPRSAGYRHRLFRGNRHDLGQKSA